MKLKSAVCLTLLTIALIHSPARAQIQMARSVVGSGWGGGSGPNNSIDGTVGQAVIGTISGPNIWHHIGFWTGQPDLAGIDDLDGLPLIFKLQQNHPNPFNPHTTIAFDLPKQTAVSLRVFDVSGRLVTVLLEGEIEGAGRREVVWTGRDDYGQQVAAGVYFYRLDAGEYSETKRMALVK